jgi:hypothetical protein
VDSEAANLDLLSGPMNFELLGQSPPTTDRYAKCLSDRFPYRADALVALGNKVYDVSVEVGNLMIGFDRMFDMLSAD